MSNIVENAIWSAFVRLFDTNAVLTGGADSAENLPISDLANRTLWLKQFIESVQTGLSIHEAAVDPHSQYMTAAESNTVIAAAIAALVNSSPTTLDTLNEIALALGNDPNFAATITAALGTKLTQAQTDALYLKLIGGDLTGPITQKFSGLYWQGTPAGGAFVRKYADVANAATVGAIEDGTVYNCAVDPATGIWAGRDVADLCWLEKWSDTGGQKEYWFAPTAAAGSVPVWAKAFTLDIPAGKIVFSDGTKQSTLPKFNTQTITTSGNFTTPANITTDTVFKITLLGGGGGGGGTVGVSVAGGGGAGAVATFLISGLQPNTNYAVVIGAGGSPGAAGGANNGTTGGTTQITINGVVYSCSGGIFGRQASGSGFTPTQAQGTVSASITALNSAVIVYQAQTRDGFYSVATVYVVGLGGGIPFGQGGDTYEGIAASGYGAGGCGGMGGLAGIAGRPGLCIIEWVA